MPRTRQFNHTVWLRLTDLQHALVSFYAHRYSRDATRIIRGMIKQYVLADTAFDPKKFTEFVEAHVIPDAKGDPALEAEIRSRVHFFLESIPGSQLSPV